MDDKMQVGDIVIVVKSYDSCARIGDIGRIILDGKSKAEECHFYNNYWRIDFARCNNPSTRGTYWFNKNGTGYPGILRLADNRELAERGIHG